MQELLSAVVVRKPVNESVGPGSNSGQALPIKPKGAHTRPVQPIWRRSGARSSRSHKKDKRPHTLKVTRPALVSFRMSQLRKGVVLAAPLTKEKLKELVVGAVVAVCLAEEEGETKRRK